MSKPTGLVGRVVEYEKVEYVLTNRWDRIDGFRGTIVGVNSYVLDGEHKCEALVLQSYPNYGEVDEVGIHKIKVLTTAEAETSPVLRLKD